MKPFILVAAVCLCLLLARGAYLIEQEYGVEVSPCGTINLTTHDPDRRGGSMFHYFDDGKRVWRISGIKSPVSDGAKPVVEMELVFERSPHNCTVWKMEQGIKD